jgi:hypothetical protein
MSLTITNLKRDIKNDLKAWLDENRQDRTTQTPSISSDGENIVVTDIVIPAMLKPGLKIEDILDKLVDIIVERVVQHIDETAEIINGNITDATLTYTNTLPGYGGGVPGPVTVQPSTLIIKSGKISIDPKGIK